MKAHHTKVISGSASREAPKSSHTRSVGMQPSSTLAREENHLQEKVSNFCAAEGENKTPTALSQGTAHRARRREHVTRGTRCDAWSQTERFLTEAEKVDVATQCGSSRVCVCGGSLPAARSPGGVSRPSTAGPAGEHERAAQAVPQPAGPGSAAGTGAFSSEAEYLSLAGSRTLEVLNFIEKMKARDKQ